MIPAAERWPIREAGRVGCVLLFLLTAGRANADAGRVVLALPSTADEAVSEVATRVKAELRAATFDVVTMTLLPDPSGGESPESVTRAMHPTATLSVARVDDRPVVDLWIRDRHDKLLTKRLVLGRRSDADATSDLAIHAVELLRATLLETHDGSGVAIEPQRDRATTPADAATENTGPARRSIFEGRTIALGGALLHDFGAVSPAVAPTLRMSLGHPSGLAGRISVTGPALGGKFERAKGTASVRQELAIIEIVYAPSRAMISPFVSAGVGAYHVFVSGEPSDARYSGDAGSAWAALFDLGVGLATRLGANTAIAIDLHAFVADPGPRVAIGDAPEDPSTKPLGQPSFSTSLALQSSF